MTIRDLQRAGATVRVAHYRRDGRGLIETEHPARLFRANGVPVAPTGGTTVVRIEMDGRVYAGEARCSKRDNFCRRRGREIAIGRALKAGPVPVDDVLSVAAELGVDVRHRAFVGLAAEQIKEAWRGPISRCCEALGKGAR